MILSRNRVQINEGGFVCGVTWVRGHFIDAWFRLPLKGCRSHRFTRVFTRVIK